MLEGLVALSVLLLLWAAIAWLGRFQDMALQTTHASRFAAFSLARNPDARPVGDLRKHYFSGTAHQWADRRGHALLSHDGSDVWLSVARSPELSGNAQPGGSSGHSQRLRQDWEIEDTGIARAVVIVTSRPSGREEPVPASPLKMNLRQFDGLYPRLTRHTAILTGAGHSPSDHSTQDRVAQSPLGWQDSAGSSYELGRRIQSRMQAVDQGWSRPVPVFDWLGSWAGEIPNYHLKNFPEQNHEYSHH